MSSNTQEIICVCCPCGCQMEVEIDAQGNVTNVSGNECARGVHHAIDEVTAPARVLTLQLCVAGALEPLSVKTAAPIPKTLMAQAASEIAALAASLHSPVAAGSIVLESVCETGIPVIATKSI